MSFSTEQIAKALGGAKKSGSGWMALCPAHDDKNPSLSLKNEKGKVLVYCHAGCSQDDIIAALRDLDLWSGSTQREPNPPKPDKWNPLPSAPNGTPEPDFQKLLGSKPLGVWRYYASDGNIAGYACRIDGKDGKHFIPISYCQGPGGKSGWRMKAMAPPRPLYNLSELTKRPTDPVLVVEGEKAADAARKLFPDHVVVTWVGGSNAPAMAAWEALEGRTVIIWPDADEPGRKAVDRVAGLAEKAGAKSVRIVGPLVKFPKGWDLADKIPPDTDIHDLLAGAENADAPILKYVMTAPELAAIDLPPREFIIDPFLPSRSLSMVYAPRGVGKTWFALTLAFAVAEGSNFLSFEVPKARRVLFIDGEMALQDLQGRINDLRDDPSNYLCILPSELVFQDRAPININDVASQNWISALLDALEKRGIGPELIILDNLSSLSSGVNENDNTEQDQILLWMIKMRHSGFSVLLVHHAGKSGDQRGASRREDFLDTTISLKPPDKGEHAGPVLGARFVVEFTKTRGLRPTPDRLDLALGKNERGKLEWTIKEISNLPVHVQLLREIYVTSPRTQQILADAIGESPGGISQKCAKLRELKLLGKKLDVTDKGLEYLISIWPDIEDEIEDPDRELPF